MEIYLQIAILVLVLVVLLLLFLTRRGKISEELSVRLDQLGKSIERVDAAVREEVKNNRQEQVNTLSTFQTSLIEILNVISKTQLDQLKAITDSNREELARNLKDFQTSFDRNVESFNNTQKEKFGQLEIRQQELIQNTEKKLEQMRVTVDEKLQKTLDERLGKSFELVSRQLEGVQKGLGEMQVLAQDVGGLKKVLGNVKMRGGVGEVRLGMLLEQLLAPEQYEANVKTKQGSSDVVEYAKLPGRGRGKRCDLLRWMPSFRRRPTIILLEAADTGDPDTVETRSKTWKA
jgi:DNA recombination protein RmuC